MNEDRKRFRFKRNGQDPTNSLPLGVKRFFKRTHLFDLNLIKDPSNFKTSFLDLIKIAFNLLFFFTQLFGFVSFTLTLTKLLINAYRLFDPPYKWKILVNHTPHLSIGIRTDSFWTILFFLKDF